MNDMEKKELTTDETRQLMAETRGYQDGRDSERRRILRHLRELQKDRVTHAHLTSLIEWVEGDGQ